VFLLDTVAVSQTARRHPNPGYMAWLASKSVSELYLSAVTIGELTRGVALANRRDPVYSRRLAVWLSWLVGSFGERVLPIDTAVASIWGSMVARQPAPPPIDSLIAATAFAHGYPVVTENVRDFSATGVPVLNPFS
jgi:predicted nucleic acid-binding protein